MKKAVYFFPMLTLLALPQAQAQSAQDVLYKVDQMQKNARDLSFRLTGRFTLGGADQNMDVFVKTIPRKEVVRMEFRQPQSLSGDVIVSDKNEVRQYWSLSNQITVTKVSEAARQAGLGLDFSQLGDVTNFSSDTDVKLLGTSNAGGGRLFKLQAKSKSNPQAGTAFVWVTDRGWRPTRVQMFTPGGELAADLRVNAFRTDAGLSESALRSLPRGARVVQQ